MAFFTRRGVSVPEIPSEQQDLATAAGTSSAQLEVYSLPSKNSSKTSSSSSVLDMKAKESPAVTPSKDEKFDYVVDRNLGVEV